MMARGMRADSIRKRAARFAARLPAATAHLDPNGIAFGMMTSSGAVFRRTQPAFRERFPPRSTTGRPSDGWIIDNRLVAAIIVPQEDGVAAAEIERRALTGGSAPCCPKSLEPLGASVTGRSTPRRSAPGYPSHFIRRSVADTNRVRDRRHSEEHNTFGTIMKAVLTA